MRVLRLAVLATAVLMATAVFAQRAEAQQKSARIRVSVTVVSNPMSLILADGLVAAPDKVTPERVLPSGVHIVVTEPLAELPDGERSEAVRAGGRTRRIVIEYVGT